MLRAPTQLHEVLVGVLLAIMLASTSAAQITTENAGVTSPELQVLRESVSVTRTENLDEVRWKHELVFAPDRSHEFRLTVPILWREARFSSTSGAEESESAGLGDVSLRLKQALWRSDDGRALDAARRGRRTNRRTRRARERRTRAADPSARHRRMDDRRGERLYVDPRSAAALLGRGHVSPLRRARQRPVR
jgi:hypothetical protein